mmetsp:Transcript_33814/g.47172  ORF Transcript_33814/g.47172 Transcript_33814/m.47172 type:complete len:263 (+) Transcript_33814:57-845(+)
MLDSLVITLSFWLLPVSAVKYGDEAFQSAREGTFYAFCNGNSTVGIQPSIDVIDPVNGTVLKSIPAPSATVWADPVYMETCDGSNRRFVLANDRGGNVVIINADSQEINSVVPMSAAPVHGYGVPMTEEFWSHSDGDGVFDVLDLERVDQLKHQDIIAHVAIPGHGKLLWDEDFYPRAFVTNVREPFVFEIDLITHQMVQRWNFTEYGTSHPFYCPGTHGISYSRINRHIYATCSSVGLIEIDIVNFGVMSEMMAKQRLGGR